MGRRGRIMWLRRYDDPNKIDWGKVAYLAILITITMIAVTFIAIAFVKELSK